MDLRTIPRTLFEQSIRAARLPVDVAVRLVEGPDPVGPVHIAVERTDASAREMFGRMTGDRGLVAEAARLRSAADKRTEALKLRAEARRDHEDAVKTIDAGRRRAASRRRVSNGTADAREASAGKAQKERLSQVDSAEVRQREAVHQAERAAERALEKEERRARLSALDVQDRAVSQKEGAITSREEARRLQDAAAAAKEDRKSGR
jgi:hypothetical protein